MSNLFTVRRFPRADQPQLVYQAALDANVRAWGPAFRTELGSERSRDLASLDVRRYDWSPEQGWLQPAVDQVTRAWSSVWSSELAGERSRDRGALDVRRSEWAPAAAWYTVALVDTVTPTRAGIWALQRDHGRSAAAAALDVRTHTWGSDGGWIGTAATAPTIAKWAPVFKAETDAFRSTTRAPLDVRSSDWSPETGWLPKVVDSVVATWTPSLVSERRSLRSPDRRSLDIRIDWRPETGWVSALVSTPTTTAQLRPAVAGPGGVRTEARPALDVRRYDPFPEIGWIYKAAIAPRHGVHYVGLDVFVSGIPAGLGDVIVQGAGAGLETGTTATGIPAGGSEASGLVWGIDDAF